MYPILSDPFSAATTDFETVASSPPVTTTDKNEIKDPSSKIEDLQKHISTLENELSSLKLFLAKSLSKEERSITINNINFVYRRKFQGEHHLSDKDRLYKINADGTRQLYYRGPTKNFLPHGFGEIMSSSGLYIGQLVDGMRHGHGEHLYTNGDKYVGEFQYNMPHGLGNLTYKNGNTYQGEFLNGLKHGRGEETYANGTKYIGEYRNDKPHGKGKIIYQDGREYRGEIWNGLSHGTGTMIFVNGQEYVGEYKNGSRHGKGIEKLTDGKFMEVVYKNGERISYKMMKSPPATPNHLSTRK